MAAMGGPAKHLKTHGCWMVRTGKAAPRNLVHSPINGGRLRFRARWKPQLLANAILKQAGLPKAF